MAEKNPVRGQYLLQGLDLIRAGIVTRDGETLLIREDTKAQLPSIDPRTERWLTSGAVTAAAAASGLNLGMNQLPADAVLPYLQQSWKGVVRTTEDHILHMLPGHDTPENRAFAQDQIAQLELTYLGKAVKAA